MDLGKNGDIPSAPVGGSRIGNYARKEGCDWVFTDASVELFRMLSIPIRHHVLLRGASNPYDPEHSAISLHSGLVSETRSPRVHLHGFSRDAP